MVIDARNPMSYPIHVFRYNAFVIIWTRFSSLAAAHATTAAPYHVVHATLFGISR